MRDIDELRQMDSTAAAQARPHSLSAHSQARASGSFSRAIVGRGAGYDRGQIRAIDPKQLAFYLTARGITNESYYAAAKVARFLGTNNIDNASRICHSPSKTALKRSVGIGASSCNYKDWIGTDVLVFWGSVAANNQPVSTKYMYAAKRKGTKIIVINPYREPAMDGYWIPSIAESALFGTKLADDFYQVNIGGDIAFMNGVMKHWFEMEEARARLRDRPRVRRARIRTATKSCARMWRSRTGTRWSARPALPASGCSEFAELLAGAAVRACSCGAWGSRSIASARTTSRRSPISPCCAAFSAASIAASCRFAATAACRAPARWAPIRSACPAANSTSADIRAHRASLGLPAAQMAGRYRRRHAGERAAAGGSRAEAEAVLHVGRQFPGDDAGPGLRPPMPGSRSIFVCIRISS